MNHLRRYIKGLISVSSLLILTGCLAELPTLGVQNNRLHPCPSTPNCVASHPDTPKTKRIAPLTYKAEQSFAYEQLLELIKQRKDAIVVEMEHAHYIRADFRSPILGFIDDVEFYFQIPGIIELRSESRLGFYDLGKNRSRLEEIRQQFNFIMAKPVANNENKVPLQTD
ncbi:DUF1499 domain-containing protein [Oceanospirillum beijerinckii]|uniref:DUF1499 domain-containing protein n=1 Tax=Oceanospirillum beijerinckii TaxID=64976 RepID=UPI00040B0745|nr:DUF1499 domain-containing protein [Oceanospirillum beijerinckii]MAC46357.1 DUF1499 domain-containing protein [Oceanospirillum sp.]